jgi:hypothetical protein
MLALLLVTQAAYAFYNPSNGTWLSRDPVREEGFRLSVNQLPIAGRQPPNLYVFLGNEPVGRLDYLGLKFEPPSGTNCKDPCKFALEHAMDEFGKIPYGVVVCCNGKAYPCVLKPSGRANARNARNADARQIISSCILAHEESHLPAVKCPKPCGWKGPYFASLTGDTRTLECSAYRAQLACLQQSLSLGGCDGHRDCESEVWYEIHAIEQAVQQFCN